MSAKNSSTRRSFLKRGALLAVPLAAAAPAAVIADDDLTSRLAKLENEAAICRLHQDWLRRINSGTRDAMPLLGDSKGAALGESVRRISAEHASEPDMIEMASDGKSATGRFHCVVETETAIPQDCTLAQMAHAQGGGFVRCTDRRILHVEYVKAAGGWSIVKAGFAPV